MDGLTRELLARDPAVPFFVIDPARIRTAVATLRAALPHVQIFYTAKANDHPAVLAAVAAAGCGVNVSHRDEAERLFATAPDCPAGVFAPHPDAELLRHPAVRRARYVSVNSEAAAQACVDARFEGAVLIRVRSTLVRDSRKFGCDDPDAVGRVLSAGGRDAAGTHVHAGTNVEDPARWRSAIAAAANRSRLPLQNAGGGFPAPSRLAELGLSLRDFVDDLPAEVVILEPGRYLVDDAVYCVSRIVAVDGSRVFLDVGSNALPPLTSSRYRVHALIRRSGEMVREAAGGDLALFDRGCMDVEYLPRLAAASRPGVGDLVVLGRCGAYTYALLSDFGAPKPDVIVYDHAF